MAVGVSVWYSGDRFAIDFSPLFMFSYITQVSSIIFPLKWFYSKIAFHHKYLDVVSTLSDQILSFPVAYIKGRYACW